MAGFGGSVKLTGETEYNKALKRIRQGLRECSSEMKLASAEFQNNTKSTQELTARTASLSKTLENQKKAISDLKSQYNSMASQYDEQMKKQSALSSKYDEEKKKLAEIGRTLGESSDEYKAQAKVLDDVEKELNETKTANERMSNSLSTMRTQINNAETSLIKTENSLNQMNEELEDTSKEADTAGNKMENLGDNVEDSGKKFSGLKSVAGGALKAIGVALATVTAGAVALGKNAIESYANYEQLVGGVETLFGTGGKSLKEYAQSMGKSVSAVKKEFTNYQKAQSIVLKNADKAYKTAGLNANEYMETATTFSSALIKSLGGDTVASAKLADTAIKDMSDNANKMGTDMEEIQTVYSSLSKQQYQTLDNLKLGYAGSQKGAYQLLQDASKLNSEFAKTAKYSMDSSGHLEVGYADMVKAIHIVQEEMGITGTTALEAEHTIEGSLKMTKSAWANLTTEIAKDNGDSKKVIGEFVSSVVALSNNLVPRIKQIVSGIGELVNGLLTQTLPVILKELPSLLSGLLPPLLKAVESVFNSVGAVLPELVNVAFNITDILISETLPNLLKQLPQLLKNIIPQLVDIIKNLIKTLSTALPEVLKILVQDVLPVLVTEILNALPDLIDAIYQLAISIVNLIPEIIQILAPMIPKLVDSVIKALTDEGTFTKLLDGALSLYMAIIEAIPLIIEALVPQIPKIVKSIAQGLIKAIPILLSASVTLFDTYVEAFQKAGASVKKLIPVILKSAKETFLAYIGYIKDIWSAIKNVFSGVVDFYKKTFEKASQAVREAFSGLKAFFSNLWDGIKDKAKDFGVKIGSAIGGAVKGAINAVIKTIESTFNKTISLINGAIKLINKIPNVKISKMEELELPRLAKGGIVTKSTIAEIGESGAEAVIPLEKSDGWLNKLADKINSNNDYNSTVRAFKDALSDMEVVLDGDEVGTFVTKTVARAIY